MLTRSAALDLAAPTSCAHATHSTPAQAAALLRPSAKPKLVICASGMQSAASAPSEALVSTSTQSAFPKSIIRVKKYSLMRHQYAHCAAADI